MSATPAVLKTSSDLPHYGAILWDNDGVLVDTERWYFQATREVLAGVGIDLTVELYFEYFLARSGGAWHLASARGISEADIAAMRDDRNERYLRMLEQEPIAMAGVRETLAALRPHFVMGIVTSSRRAHFEAIHRRTGLLEFFDFALTLEDYPRSKPAPDPYLAAVARSGLPAGRCLAIEDAPRGLMAARAAALDCWVIPSEFTREAPFSGATRTLAQISDVSSLLLAGKRRPHGCRGHATLNPDFASRNPRHGSRTQRSRWPENKKFKPLFWAISDSRGGHTATIASRR